MKSKKDKAPRTYPKIKKHQKKGLILVHTGGGKGKSTAAFGTAFRALGRGFNVAMVQFIKGAWKTGEEESAKIFKGRFKVYPMGQGFTWNTKDFEKDAASARKAWEKCQELLFDKTHELVIFDEINYVLKYNFLEVQKVIEALKKKPALKHVILTGNGAPKKLIDLADLVTEMKCVKHPFQKGIVAQPGIEY